MQDWLPASLTTATTFKSQKILFKARALGSNLLQPKGDYVHLTSQYYSASIETRPPQLHSLLCFSAVLSPLTFYGPPPPSYERFCDIRISSYLFNKAN